MNKARIKWEKTAVLLICVLLSFFCAVTVKAEQQHNQVLKVAYYPLDNFFEYDERGKEVGYGVEVLDKISQYTGLKFEYVKADAWEDTKQMLIDGKADIRMPGTMPVTPSTVLGYSRSGILDTYEVMLTMKTRDDLYYQDYDKIHTLKIAIVDSFYSAEDVKKYLKDIGVSESQLVFCTEYNECYDMLRAGKVDALITNIMDMTDDLKMLARFNTVSNYITTLIDSPYLPVINEAIDNINLEEPMFFSNLYATWFPDRVTIPLTMEESEYLSSVDTLTFAFRTDEGYLSHCRDGQFYGIYVDQAKLICEKLGKKFRAVSIEDCLKGKETTDVYAGFFYDQNCANEWGFKISVPVHDINYYIVQKKEKNYNPKNSRIAAISKFKYTEDYLKAQYRDASFQYYDSYEDCLKAVEKGKADVTIINNYIAEYYLGMYQYSDLSVRLSNDYSHMFCLATSDQNEYLAPILTKAISMISDKEMSNTYITGQEDKASTKFFEGILYKMPLLVLFAVAVIVTIIIAFIMLTLFTRKQQKQNVILEQALSAKSTFLARMSHDMRTPLNVIIGMDRLAKNNDNPEDTTHCLEKIDIASEFLLGLINDILDLERVNSGKTILHLEPYSGKEFSQYIDAVIAPLCKEKKIRFSYTYSGKNDFVIMQDKLRINQIYFNILSNAAKFTPEGGKIDFHTDFHRTNYGTIKMKVTISDNGIGMSDEFQKHMFEAFSQEEQKITPVGTGTGLGLAIVKNMCDLMNMDVSVTSKPGIGTTFTIHGEYETAQDVKQEENNAVTESEKKEAVLKDKKILVCEDHPVNQEIVRRILALEGMVVEMAENGQVGLDKFKEASPGSFDAVVMDMRMPVMDGVQAAEEIRKLPREDAKTVPIIAVTANAYEEDIKRCMEAGMNAHLSKPIEPDRLYELLRKLI